MPELPEVETVVRDLRSSGLVGRTIHSVRVFWPRTIGTTPVRRFRAELTGRRVNSVERRGKFIVLELSGDRVLLIHLRMTGRLTLSPPDRARDPHEHVIVGLDDERDLRFRDTRKFGRWTLSKRPAAALAALGPEPLAASFTYNRFARRLAGRAGMLKPLLLNQGFIAGLGNIYVDEALWDAGLHPQRPVSSLTEDDRRRLYRAIRKVLRRGVRAMGTTLGTAQTNFYSVAGRSGRNQDGLKVFRRTGLPCPRCRAPVIRIVVAQRGTHICAECQRPAAARSDGRRRRRGSGLARGQRGEK